MSELNDQEQVFVDNYLINLSPYESAIAAGYAESTAKVKAWSWVSHSKCPDHKMHVYNAVQKAMKKRSEKTGIDAQWVLNKLALLAEFNINKFIRVVNGNPVYDFSKATEDDWYCITEITFDTINKAMGDDLIEVERVKLKSVDKLKAIQLAGNHVSVQAFNEKTTVEVVDKAAILTKARKRAGP